MKTPDLTLEGNGPVWPARTLSRPGMGRQLQGQAIGTPKPDKRACLTKLRRSSENGVSERPTSDDETGNGRRDWSKRVGVRRGVGIMNHGVWGHK
jgi:hypothetical protein